MIKPRSRCSSATPSAAPKDAASEPRSPELGDAIGRELKAMFDHVATEPVPDRFRRLIDELERKSGKS